MAKIKHVILTEKNALPSTAFPTSLSNCTVNLSSITFNNHDMDGVILQAVINWRATFTPNDTTYALTTPGFADVTFELLLNGQVVYRVSQTAMQKGIPLTGNFATATSTDEMTVLLHFDIPVRGNNTYTLQATNIVLTAPVLASGTATTSAAVGAVTFVVEEVVN